MSDKMREAMIDQDGLVWEKIGGAWSMYRQAAQSASVPVVSVWYGEMPESNGKSNWTALLCRDGDVGSGITIERSEYPDRVRYEADRVRFLIGEINEEPCILDYDAEKHSGYVKAEIAAVPVVGDVEKMAASISSMVLEWVTDAGANGGDWQSGLPTIIRSRIERFQPTTSITAAELDALRNRVASAECDLAAAVAEGDRIMRDWQEQIRKTCAALKQRNDAEQERDALRKDAERYRWLRDPSVYVGKVIDKVAGYEPMTELGTGGYPIYEYRAGPELDEAIDAAIAQGKGE